MDMFEEICHLHSFIRLLYFRLVIYQATTDVILIPNNYVTKITLLIKILIQQIRSSKLGV